VVEAAVTPRGRYVLQLGHFGGPTWQAALPDGERASARQSVDGRVLIRATSPAALERARFMLALDDDHGEFVRRFRADPLLGPTVRALPGLRPHRLATVAHALLHGICGQLIQSSRARQLERRILRAAGTGSPRQEDLARFAPAQLRALGLATERGSALVRLCRTLDLERLRDVPTPAVLARLGRERSVGPWTCGVVVLAGLGRWDHGLVGDLGLIKLMSALRGRWVEPAETRELLAPYGEWQGLAGAYLLAGWKRGLIPGANADTARLVRVRARAA
jgi:AraC family transcriptional regulator of adaptative response / DNA-3-methyladenine glycosylase II